MEGAERTLATLTAHLQLLADEADQARGRVALAFLHTLGTEAEPRIAFEGEEAATCQGLVGAGLGVALLPATGSAAADPEVVAVKITAPRAARTVGLVWMAGRLLVPPVAAFRDFALGYRGRLLRC